MEKICKSCGTTLSEFYRNTLLGCPDCYTVFEEELKPILKELHGVTVHKGKRPLGNDLDHKLLSEYRRLLSEKEKAMLENRFADAVEIGDEIRKVAQEMEKRGIR